MSSEELLSSSFWTTKMKTYFKVMDVDQNGFLSLSEFEETAERLVQLQDNPSKAEDIREVFRSLFQYFVAGGEPVDSETQIAEEEFLAKAAKTISLSPPPAVEVGKRKNVVFFDAIDTDGSGEISPEEYRKYLAIYSGGDDAERAKQAFDSIDIDGNGLINRSEFVQAHVHYWFEGVKDPNYSPLPYGPLVDS